METALGDETLYTDPARKGKLSELLGRHGDLKSRHEESEMALLDAMQALEDAETDL